MGVCILDRTILIIGAGQEQIPAYLKAKKRGLVVVGTDLNADAPAFKYADFKLIASTRDADATEVEALKFNAFKKINGVMTIANDVPYTVARVASRLGLNSIDLKAASNFSDKYLMKKEFLKHGVMCPKFYQISTLKELTDHLKNNRGVQHVIKPVDGRGARGVLQVNDMSDLDWAFSESRSWGDSGRLILEEFIPGLQISTESFIDQGVCYTPAFAERNYSRIREFSPYIIEDGGTIPAQLELDLKIRINELILKGAKSLGLDKGIVKGDIVIDSSGNPLIIELAARLSGGWFASHQIPEATGVDLVDVAISYALGDEIHKNELLPTKNLATAIRYWFPEAGRIKTIIGEDKLQLFPGLISYGFFRSAGDIQPQIKKHADRLGYLIVSGADRSEAMSRVNEALEIIQIEVE